MFAAIGCASCHTPALHDGPSRDPRLRSQGGAALLRPAAARHRHRRRDPAGGGHPEEIRTPALWGLRFRRPLLHDGSAATIEEAIAAPS